MRNYIKQLLLSVLALLGILVGATQAQAQVSDGQRVQQSPIHLDAATALVGTSAAVNTAVTLTLAAVSGQYHYIQNLTITLCQDTTASTSLQIAVSSTNVGGFTTQVGQASAAGSCSPFPFVFPTGLKSTAPGTVTTIVVAAPGAHGAAIINAAFYTGS